MFKKIVILFLFHAIISICECQSQSNSTQQDFNTCNCDLLNNICDVGCCCDKSCNQNDYSAFQCPESTKKETEDRKWCVPKSALFLENTPYILNSLDSLLCVDLNNSAALNYYQAPLTEGAKEDYVKQLVDFGFPKSIEPLSYNALALDQNLDKIFNISDYVWILLSNDRLGFLSLPNQVGAKCKNGPPLKYYTNKKSECVLNSAQIRAECNGNPTPATSLSLKYFIENFKIIKKPNSLKKCSTAQNPSSPTFSYYASCTGDHLKEISLRSCTLADGSISTTCSTNLANYLTPQNVVAENKCKNLVKRVVYYLKYKDPDGTIETALDVEFFDYDLTNTNTKSIEQTFEVFFVPDPTSLNDFNPNNKLSGNPGYIQNEPIQAGPESAVPLILDRNKRFTHMNPSANGACPTDDSTREPIRFNTNVFTECQYKPNTLNPTSATFCKDLQTNIFNIIQGFTTTNRASFYAPFANTERSEWQPITNTNPVSNVATDSSLGGVCKSLIVGATIQIAYALVGNVDNPQAKLVFVSYDWNELTNVNLRCVGLTCQNDLILDIKTRVTFVDVSQPPLYSESKMKRPSARLPGDFFYPLTSSTICQLKNQQNVSHVFLLSSLLTLNFLSFRLWFN